MLNHGDTRYQKTITKDDIDISEEFDFEKTHFNVAVGFVTQESGEKLESDRYMKWSANLRSIDREGPTEGNKINFAPVDMRQCTESDTEKFFSDIDQSLKPIISEMQCIDKPQSIKFFGNLQKSKALQIFLHVPQEATLSRAKLMER